RRGDAVLHQLHDGPAGVLDDARDRDHGTARRRVVVSLGPACAARAAPARGRRRRGALVVSLHARLSGRAPDRRRTRPGGRARLRGPACVARGLDRGVSRHVDAGAAQVWGGWDYWEVVVLLGVFNALTGVIEAVLRPGIGRLAGEVRSGGLDLVLAKPVDPQGFVSFRRLDIWRLTDVVLGLALAGYALHRLGRTPSLAQLAAFALALASAAVVVYALWVVLMSLAFWFVSVENLSVLFDAVYEGARYPVSAYPDALRFLFVYLIPIAWTTTIPASALTGRLGPEIGVVAALVAGVAFALARLVWRAALKRYTGASG